MTKSLRPILVLGIGNILLGDEGVGVRVIEALQELELPDDVELVDGGTAGADLLDVICGRSKVIVVDACDADQPSGTVLRLPAEALDQSSNASMSLHEIGLMDTIGMAQQLGEAPEEVIVYGIVPETIEPGEQLSKSVAAAVPHVVDCISKKEMNITAP